MILGCRMRKDATLWVSVLTSYNERLMPYLKKGQAVMISGEADIKSFTRRDGGAGVDVSVFAYSLQLVGRAENAPQAANGQQPNNYPSQQANTVQAQNNGQIADDNMPF